MLGKQKLRKTLWPMTPLVAPQRTFRDLSLAALDNTDDQKEEDEEIKEGGGRL